MLAWETPRNVFVPGRFAPQVNGGCSGSAAEFRFAQLREHSKMEML
jgi:hypothetical protein